MLASITASVAASAAPIAVRYVMISSLLPLAGATRNIAQALAARGGEYQFPACRKPERRRFRKHARRRFAARAGREAFLPAGPNEGLNRAGGPIARCLSSAPSAPPVSPPPLPWCSPPLPSRRRPL